MVGCGGGEAVTVDTSNLPPHTHSHQPPGSIVSLTNTASVTPQTFTMGVLYGNIYTVFISYYRQQTRLDRPIVAVV